VEREAWLLFLTARCVFVATKTFLPTSRYRIEVGQKISQLIFLNPKGIRTIYSKRARFRIERLKTKEKQRIVYQGQGE
jgi:hypothetical protein